MNDWQWAREDASFGISRVADKTMAEPQGKIDYSGIAE